MFRFSSYLDSVDTSELGFELRSTQNACMYATARPGLIRATVCGYRTRQIVLTGPEFALDRSHPDPFSEATRIDFTLGIDGPVTLTIHDAMGRLVATLVDGPMASGPHSVLWDASSQPAGAWSGFNAGMRGIKGSQYDGGHRTPCFIRWPAGHLGGGADVARLTAHIDLLPTLIDLCGLPPPQGVQFDGTSLAPLLRDVRPRLIPYSR